VIAVAGSVRDAESQNQDDRRQLYRYLASWYGALETIEAKVVALHTPQDIAIWGAGIHLEFLYQFTSLFSGSAKRRFAVIDTDEFKQGKSWRGVPILSPDALKSVDWSTTRLLVSTYGGQAAVVGAAKELGVPENAIITLYEGIGHR
jgi:hypothetical protein